MPDEIIQTPHTSLFPRFAVQRPVTVSMVMVTLIVLGIISLTRIPQEMMPKGYTRTRLTVFAPYPNSSPDEILKKIIEPTEEEIKKISGVISFRSFLNSNNGRLIVEFEGNANMIEMYSIVKNRLDRLTPELPEDFDKFFLYKRDDDSRPIVWLAASLEKTAQENLPLIREQIQIRFSRLEGVAKIDIIGINPKEIHIAFDQNLIQNYNVNIGKVIQDLRNDNFALPSGKLQEEQTWFLRSIATYKTIQDLENRKIGYGDLRLKDLAEIRYDFPEQEWQNLFNGKNAITIAIYQESDANTIEVTKRIENLTESLKQKGIVGKLKMNYLMKESTHIKNGINNLVETSAWGGLFALGILFLFLRKIRLTLMIITAVPLSILITIIVLDFSGLSINIFSLMGFMVGLGMLVDNSVVVVENIARIRTLGYSKKDSAIQGTSQVAISILLSTLTTIVVFLPAIFLGTQGQMRFFMIHIGFPIIISLVASLFVAMIFIPLAATFFIDQKQKEGNSTFQMLQSGYRKFLSKVLENKYQFLLLIVIVLLCTTFIPLKHLKVTGTGQGSFSSIFIRFRFPPTWLLEEATQYFRNIENQLSPKKNELGILSSYIWHSDKGGNLILFLDTEKEERPENREIIKQLKKLFPETPGVHYKIAGERGGETQNSEMEIRIFGSDPIILENLAKQIIQRLEGVFGIEELELDLEDQEEELVILIDRGKAQNLGINPRTVAQQISYTIRGIHNLPRIHMGDQEIEVIARQDEEDREGINRLKTMLFFSENGETVKLDHFSSITFRKGKKNIRRKNGKSNLTIQGKLNSDNFSKTQREIIERLADFPFPPGYSWGQGESFQELKEDQNSLKIALLLSIILVYLIMGVLFESFLLPFSILISIPMAFIGSVWLLFLTETSLDTMGFIGLIILIGVVVNNAIVLVDTINQYRKKGMERKEAILLAAEHRLRPILMTSLTTIFGLLPMALGGANIAGIPYAPLGRTVAGGLASSMFLTLFVVPIFYTYFDQMGLGVKRLFRQA